MHEYSLVLALLEQVQKQARHHGATKVDRIRLRVGAQSGVEIELLETAYDLAKLGSICETASLEMKRSPVVWKCPVCDDEIQHGTILRCSQCGVGAKMDSGDEILLEQLEMEIPDV